MELRFHLCTNPLIPSASHLRNSPPLPQFFFLPAFPARKRRSRPNRRPQNSFRAFASRNEDGSGDFSWEKVSRSLRVGSERFWSKFTESMKKETGFDYNPGKLVERVVEVVNTGKGMVDRFRFETVPAFVDWNQWENWKVFF
ncbi:hypothetical protein KSP40_PGU018068 [Platanthera guangdongensis]|uniref:Uncharacterized protein n=1 Tax=Platanthera guangdongensis TaxID=2320717 RepID=A0ABR2MCV2_9ASPA